jgi:hypothetical protein
MLCVQEKDARLAAAERARQELQQQCSAAEELRSKVVSLEALVSTLQTDAAQLRTENQSVKTLAQVCCCACITHSCARTSRHACSPSPSQMG